MVDGALSSACEGVDFAIGSAVTVAIGDADVSEVSSTLGDASEVAVANRVLCLVDEGISDALSLPFEFALDFGAPLFPSLPDVDSVVCGTSVGFVLDALSVLVLIIGMSVAKVAVTVSVATGLESELSGEELMTVATDEDTWAEVESGVDVDNSATAVLVVLTVSSAVSLFEGDEVWPIEKEVEVDEAVMSVVLVKEVTIVGDAATVLSVGVSVVIGVKLEAGGDVVGVSEPAFEDDELGGSCAEVEGEVMGKDDEGVREGEGECEELVGGIGEAVGSPSFEEEVTSVSGEDVETGMVEESVWEGGLVVVSSPRPAPFRSLDVLLLLEDNAIVRVGANSEDEVEEIVGRMVELSPVDSTGRDVGSAPLLVSSDDEEWTEVVEPVDVVFRLTEDEVVDEERNVPAVEVGLDVNVDVDRSLVDVLADMNVVLLSTIEEVSSVCVESVVPILELELIEEVVDDGDAVENKVIEELDKARDDAIVVEGDTDDSVTAEAVPAEPRTEVLVLMEDEDLVLSVATASDEVDDNDVADGVDDVADETASEVENRTALEEKLDEAISELVDCTAPEDTDEDTSAKLVDAGRATEEVKSAEDDNRDMAELADVEDEGRVVEVADVCENEDERKSEVEVEIGETFVVLKEGELEDELDDEVLDRDEDEERDEPCVSVDVVARDVGELILFSPGELEAVTARHAYGITCK